MMIKTHVVIGVLGGESGRRGFMVVYDSVGGCRKGGYYTDLVPNEPGHDTYFFFSSRRRHTSSYGAWSSDVCSSDLARTTCRMNACGLSDGWGARARSSGRVG